MKKLILSLLILGLGLICAYAAAPVQNSINYSGDTILNDNEVYIGNPDVAYNASYPQFHNLPIRTRTSRSVSQVIYLESEMAGKTGLITHLTYTYISYGTIRNNDFQIWFYYAITDIDDFGISTSANGTSLPYMPYDDFTPIYYGWMPDLPAGRHDLVLELDTPINYTGGNLVIQAFSAYRIDWNGLNGDFLNTTYTGSARAIGGSNGNLFVNYPADVVSLYSAYSFAEPHRPNIKFTFEASQSDPIFNAPTDLEIVSVSRQEVVLSWNAPDPDGDGTLVGYRVNRESETDLVYFDISNVTTYTDDIEHLNLLEDFEYFVQAIYEYNGGDIFSEPSNTVKPNFYHILPVTVTRFTAHSVSSGIQINWTTETENNMLSYRVLRAEINDVNAARYITTNDIIPQNQVTTENYNYIDRYVLNGNTYYYWLEANEINGTSEIYGPVNVYFEEIVEIFYARTFMSNTYPNPLTNGSVSAIDITVKSDETAELRIFNIRGQMVREFTGLTSGQHNIKWDGRDTDGRYVSSGIYLYQLTSPSSHEIKRIVKLN